MNIIAAKRVLGRGLEICLLAVLCVCKPVFADEYFVMTRADSTLPAHCNDPMLKWFGSGIQFVTYGIEGSRKAGFTEECPISRSDAGYLWGVLVNHRENAPEVDRTVSKKPNLKKALADLATMGRGMGFTFDKEGDVLEALAIIQLQQKYPAPEYFITGGLGYQQAGNRNLIGELDVVIGHRSDCSVVLVGETKLGTNQLSHAKSQLVRFQTFLKANAAGK